MVENGEQDDQEMSHVIRHYCNEAQGGHMRAHQMGDDDASNNNTNPSHVDHQNLRIKPHDGNKHSYFLRAKMPRFVGYRAFGNDEDNHGSLKKSSSSSQSGEYYYPTAASSEEEDLANCLVMLSNKSSDDDHNYYEENKAKQVVEKGMFQCKACKKVFNSHQALGGHRASHKKVKGCFAAKLDALNDDENVDDDLIHEDQLDPLMPSETGPTRPTSITTTTNRKRAKMHECSVCRRVFSSGQALGGHKRCHWLTTSSDNAFIPNFHDFQNDHHHQVQQQLCKKPMFTKPLHHQDIDHDHDHQLDLNLNLPDPKHENIHDYDYHRNGASGIEASTRLNLQQLANHNNDQEKVELTEKNGEKGCEMKLRKLSDLTGVNLDGGWLQMGIASTTDIC